MLQSGVAYYTCDAAPSLWGRITHCMPSVSPYVLRLSLTWEWKPLESPKLTYWSPISDEIRGQVLSRKVKGQGYVLFLPCLPFSLITQERKIRQEDRISWRWTTSDHVCRHSTMCDGVTTTELMITVVTLRNVVNSDCSHSIMSLSLALCYLR